MFFIGIAIHLFLLMAQLAAKMFMGVYRLIGQMMESWPGRIFVISTAVGFTSLISLQLEAGRRGKKLDELTRSDLESIGSGWMEAGTGAATHYGMAALEATGLLYVPSALGRLLAAEIYPGITLLHVGAVWIGMGLAYLAHQIIDSVAKGDPRAHGMHSY